MNLPVEIPEVSEVLEGIESIGASIVKPVMGTINRLLQYLEGLGNPNDDDGDEDENGDRKDCIKTAIKILTQETQGNKNLRVKKFVENTILNPKCELEDSTIFYFLKDIEQMTWRQLCLLEGFRRENNNEIEIEGNRRSGIDEICRGTEIKNLIDLNYLRDPSSGASPSADIQVLDMGKEIASLLGLDSVDIPEIGKAFGGGRIISPERY